MNAFKRGEKVNLKKELEIGDSSNSFTGKNYIKNINDSHPAYQPTTHSVTVYPSCYQKIAEEGIYTQAMRNSSLFSVETKNSLSI
jgi:hypothetical protein